MTFIDTNVLLDLFTNDPTWADWSIRQLDAAGVKGPRLINGVVYAELSARFNTIEVLDGALSEAGVAIAPMPREALFLSGKVHQRYRAAGGVRTGVLSDFFIGAQAAVEQRPLLTRDVRRYRSYFPTLELITP